MLADPPEAGIARERLLHDRRRIHERAIAERSDFGLEPPCKLGETAAKHFVIVAAKGVARDVALAAVGKHVARRFGIRRGSIHAHADDANRAGNELLRPAAPLPVARHVFHAAVTLLGEPALEVGFVLRQVDAGDADLVESELVREAVEALAQLREVFGGEGAGHVETGAWETASIIAQMEPLPAEVYSAASVKAMDRHAIERAGIAGYALMQRAGSAAFNAMRRHWPETSRLVVLCGAGNNAGDGYVLARLTRAAGLDVRVFALTDPKRLRGDAAKAHADFAADGGQAGEFGADSLEGSELIVDALLGTGLDRAVEDEYLECIEVVNRAGLPVFALDIPSGLDADTGQPRDTAIRATRTLAFIALKSGHFLGLAPEYVGAVELAKLEIPASVVDAQAPVLRRMDGRLAATALPARRRTAHKGEHGRVLVVGGFAMAGAARLAGEAALRTGAGLVTIATNEEGTDPIVTARPELIAKAIDFGDELARLFANCNAIAVGPGLGNDRAARRAFDAAVGAGRPLVVDADALSLLAAQPLKRDDWILTPHPGEAARMLGAHTAAVQRDRLGAVREIAKRYGGTCVLKGAHTLVQAPDSLPWVCDRGNPGMATAGSGDVLTGIIAALLAAGSEPAIAAAAGVLLHAEAGDRASRRGMRGMIAGDLVAELQGVVNLPWK